jgi:hypothetical protein
MCTGVRPCVPCVSRVCPGSPFHALSPGVLFIFTAVPVPGIGRACECTHGREPVRVCPGSPRCLFTTGTRYRSCVPGFGCGLARFGCGLARESVGGLVLRGFGLCGFAVRVS